MTKTTSKWAKKAPKPYMTDKERHALAGFLRGTLDPLPGPPDAPATKPPHRPRQT